MTDDNGPEDRDLLVRLDGGDERAMTELFMRHRERLRQMIRLRLDRRLQGAHRFVRTCSRTPRTRGRPSGPAIPRPAVDASVPLAPFSDRADTSRALHRHHLKVHMQDASQEVSLARRSTRREQIPASLAEMLLGRLLAHPRPARTRDATEAPGGGSTP